jgi:sulfite oxidase
MPFRFLNGAPLPAVHGYPMRIVVPGYIGARSVKRLSTITVQSGPSANYFHARTYRLFPSRVRTETSTRDRGISLGELPVTAAICSPLDGEAVRGPLRARGYAITGSGRRIERVWNLKGYLNSAWHRVRSTAPGDGSHRRVRGVAG